MKHFTDKVDSVISTLAIATWGLAFYSSALVAGQQIKSGEQKLSVVELYTSEGCSSCPPADEFLSQLGNTQEAAQIVPLAFHVDYWDYIGWEDPYAKAKFTQRQRQVAKRNRQASIYTPEFVIDGAEARGSRKISDKVKATYSSPAQAGITLDLSDLKDGVLQASVRIDELDYDVDDVPEVMFLVYENGLSSQIKAGENRGRMLKHDYVVRYLSAVEQTRDGQQHQFSVQLDPGWNVSELGVSVVVRLQKSGETLQAVKTML